MGRYDGFINIYNRTYIYRPWHRFYIIPPVNFCVINVNPYRQFYSPVRHIWYRPYRNNVRYYNVNAGRRGNTQVVRRNSSDSYAQTPRNRSERTIQRTVSRRNAEITRTRTTRLAEQNTTRTTRSTTSRNSEAGTSRSVTRDNNTSGTR